jgi:arsenite methyltransferase
MCYLEDKIDLNNPELIDFFDETPIWSAPFGMHILNKINYKKNSRILDIGSGTGFPVIELAQRFDKESKFFAVDPWTDAIEKMKKKIHYYKLKNIEIINDLIENANFMDDYFDVIISNNGLNNIENFRIGLKICYQKLKFGGQLLFTMNLSTSMIEFYSIFEKILKTRNMTNEIKHLKDHINKKRRPIELIIQDLNEIGFNIKNIVFDEFKYKFVDGTAMFNHYFFKLAFLDSWKEIIKDYNQQEIFSEIESELNSHSDNSGFLELSIPFVCVDCSKI